MRTRLEFELADSTWVPIQLPGEVTTIFQGRRAAVQSLFLDVPRIRYVIETVTSPTMDVFLQPEMVVYDRSLSVRAVDVRPSSVELRFERRVTREVPVDPIIETSPAPGFVIVGEPIVDPPTVTVRGTESAVDTLPSIRTERLSLRNVMRSETHRLVLLLPAGPSQVSVDPRSVQVTIDVDSLVERTLDVPLRATGRAADRVQLGQEQVSVRLRGPARAVRSLLPGSVRATVRVDAVPSAPVDLTVQVELPEGAQADLLRSIRVQVSPLPGTPEPTDEVGATSEGDQPGSPSEDGPTEGPAAGSAGTP